MSFPISREHLLTDTTAPDPGPSVIVVKGFLDHSGVEVERRAQKGRRKQHPSKKEWMLAVSKVDGTIQRFVSGGVDLIEPGAGAASWVTRVSRKQGHRSSVMIVCTLFDWIEASRGECSSGAERP